MASATRLIEPWISAREVATTILVYGEVTEYFRSTTNAGTRQDELQRVLLQIVHPGLDYPINERYAEIRRQLRPPHGTGLIGDIDTLIAATALEYDRTLVTMDTDYQPVPDLRLALLPRKT